MAVYIGTSGWSYDHWQDVLYPNGLPAVQRLDYYTARYRTVEVNSTFYRWPGDAAFVRWRQRLPEGFLFTVKAPRGLTHGARLYSPEKWLGTVKRGMDCLEEKKGILLVQLPPEFQLATIPASPIFSTACPPISKPRWNSAIPPGIRNRSFPCWKKRARPTA